MRHKKIVFRLFPALSILFALFFLPEAFPQESAEQLYEEAIFKKEVDGDLEGAIQLFLKIFASFPEERELGAKAQLQIGMCYEKLGLDQAFKAYQKVVDDYPEQKEEVRLAREKIAILLKARTLKEKGEREFNIRRIWSGYDVDFCGGPSPDGRYLSYVDWETGDLAIHDLATGKKHRLTHEATFQFPMEHAHYSRISPDGKQIAYSWLKQLSNGNYYVDLRLIGMDESSPRILYGNKDFEIHPARWFSDGKRIAVRVYDRTDKKLKIAWISVSDGDLHVIKKSEVKQTTQDCICISPDDLYIAFDLPVEEDSNNYNIYLCATDGSREIPLIEHSANDKLLGWAPSGKEVIFISDRTGTMDLWMIPVENGRRRGSPKMIKSDIGKIFPLGFTQNGSYFFSTYRSWFNSYIAAVETNTGKVQDSLKQPFKGSNRCPQWSPDGKQMAYIFQERKSAGPGFFEEVLHIYSPETGEDRELPCQLKLMNYPRWSPDGCSIMVTSFYNPEKKKGYVGGLYQINIDKEKINQLAEYALESLDAGEWFLTRGEWSADGKAIFYVSQGCILKHEVESSQKQQLYCDPNIYGGLAPSPDGKKLLCFVYNAEEKIARLLIIPVSGGEAKELLTIKEPEFFRTIEWSSDGQYILLAKDEKDGTSLWKISSEGGEPQVIWKTDKKMNCIDVHPSGKQIAFHELLQVGEIWVMENFLRR